MNLYQFKLHYYVEYEDKEYNDRGLIIAKDYIDAMTKIYKTFGKYIDEIFIKEKGIDHEVIIIPEELMPEILKCNQW